MNETPRHSPPLQADSPPPNPAGSPPPRDPAASPAVPADPPPRSPADPPSALAAPLPPRRSWLARALIQTVGPWGARFGLAWIALVALCAIFAPFLASSWPYAIRIDGRTTSPLLRHLTAADWTLLAGLIAAVSLYFLHRIRPATRFSALAALLLFTYILGALFVTEDKAPVYDQYRALESRGAVQWVLRTPIPFSPSDRLRDQFQPDRPHPWAPSSAHLLGTDSTGADILSNMIHACRIAMSIGFISTGIALAIGIVIGGLMGYFVGAVDLLGMRLVEIFGAIPTIYLLLTFVAYYDRNIYLIMTIIGFTGWVGDARFVRAEFLKLRNQDFVHAATAAGLPLRSILFKHLLPNALAPLLVSASFGVASAILIESTLSFLGLGLVDATSWGRLLEMARGEGGGFHWWLALFPGLAIFLTVLAYNLIGESLRDALDPRLQGGA